MQNQKLEARQKILRRAKSLVAPLDADGRLWLRVAKVQVKNGEKRY